METKKQNNLSANQFKENSTARMFGRDELNISSVTSDIEKTDRLGEEGKQRKQGSGRENHCTGQQLDN